jgi:hypothetical protein
MNASSALMQMLQALQPSTNFICWSSRTGVVWFNVPVEGIVRVVEEADKCIRIMSAENHI